jgi:hypothetical protein
VPSLIFRKYALQIELDFNIKSTSWLHGSRLSGALALDSAAPCTVLHQVVVCELGDCEHGRHSH